MPPPILCTAAEAMPAAAGGAEFGRRSGGRTWSGCGLRWRGGREAARDLWPYSGPHSEGYGWEMLRNYAVLGEARRILFFPPQCLFKLKFGCAEEAPRSAQRCADRGAGAGQGSGSASWLGAALRLSCWCSVFFPISHALDGTEMLRIFS